MSCFARSGRHVRLTGKGEYFSGTGKKLQEQYASWRVTQAKQISLEGDRHKLKNWGGRCPKQRQSDSC